MKHINLLLLFAIIVSACTTGNIDTPESTPTILPVTTIPLSTDTLEPSPTATPVPLGGGDLLVAFYAFGDCGSCLIIGNFFTGEVLLETPVNTSFKNDSFPRGGQIYWSPDGENILYTDMTLERMNVLLLNLKTGKIEKIGDFPAKGGTPEHWNFLRGVKWSYDSEYFIYDVGIEDDPLSKSYISSKYGVITTYITGGTNWFPDNKTIFSPYGKEVFNIETGESNLGYTDVISKFDLLYISEDFIFIQREKRNITAIPFPKNWEDPTSWQYDSLYSQIFTVAELSAEIKNGQIYNTLIQQVNENYIFVVGGIDVSNEFSSFFKLINLQDIPAVITTNDLLPVSGTFPIMISPDTNYYLVGYCTFIESCPNFDANWENSISRAWNFEIVSFNGTKQPFPSDFSQFKGVTKASPNIVNRNGELTENIAFYWKK